MRLLEVVGLTKRFAGLIALDAVSFTAEEGQILGLLGPNGAGKTTCLDCLSGLTTPDSGRIILDGREITGQAPHRLAQAGIARTFQIARPFRSLSVADNVAVALDHRSHPAVGAAPRSWRGATTRSLVLPLLERVGLAGEADRPAAELSPGLLKRLEVARALALGPRLILLDEPLAGLSPRDVSGVCELIAGLRAEGLTIVLVEHRMGLGLALADRLVILDHGVLIASGAPERVRRDPRVGAYLGEGSRARPGSY